jgi:hypothetical protein
LRREWGAKRPPVSPSCHDKCNRPSDGASQPPTFSAQSRPSFLVGEREASGSPFPALLQSCEWSYTRNE